MHLEAAARSRPASAHVFKKLEAAVILRGVVRLVLDDGPVEVEPRTWYREAGTHYLEAKRRDSGEHLVLRVDQIRDVMAF
jgi:transcriptional antiterminator Rof (Rho-off)